MATFSFERILPPGRKSAAIGTALPRGVIAQLLDRAFHRRATSAFQRGLARVFGRAVP